MAISQNLHAWVAHAYRTRLNCAPKRLATLVSPYSERTRRSAYRSSAELRAGFSRRAGELRALLAAEMEHGVASGATPHGTAERGGSADGSAAEQTYAGLATP